MLLGRPSGSCQRGVEEDLNGTAGGRCNVGIVVVHATRQPGTVVDEVELASEVRRIGCAGLFSKVDEHGEDPGPELVGGLLDETVRGSFGGGGGECAPVEVQLLVLLGLGVEYSQDLLSRIVDALDDLGSRPAVRSWREARYAATSSSLLPKTL